MEHSPMTIKHTVSGKVRLAYILAASHSGSTLLAMLLNSIPGICTAGELKATSLGDPEMYRCSCQKLIRECHFWHGIRQCMASRGFNFDVTDAGTDIRTGMSPYARRLLQPLHRSPFWEMLRDTALSLSSSWRQGLPMILARNRALIECVAAGSGAKVIVDSSKIGIRLKYLLQIPEIDISVIRLVRDGRGVALTYMNPDRFADAQDPSLRCGGTGAVRESEGLSLVAAAKEWRRSNEEAEALLAALPKSQWTEVRYEELCAHPQKTLQRLSNFLDIDPPAATTNFRTVEHHVVGNGMRLDSTSEIHLDERWRNEFSPDDLSQFESVTGPLLRKLGYQ